MSFKVLSTKSGRFSKRVSRAVSNAVQPLESRVLFAAFTPGDLVVYRVGDGSAALTSASTAVFLDEYSPTGTLVQSIPLSTLTSPNNPLTASGTATSEGNLSLSQNGENLLLGGYDSATGVASIASTNSTSTIAVTGITSAGSTTSLTVGSSLGITTGDAVTVTNLGGVTLSPSQSTYYAYNKSGTAVYLYSTQAAAVAHTTTTGLVTFTGTYTSGTTLTDASMTSIVTREIGIVGPSGSINTTTTLGSALGGNNIRGAASADGTSTLYAAGPSGVVSTTVGSTATATSIDPTQNIRSIEVNGGQLYAAAGTSTAALLGTVGTGLPTSGPLTISQLSGITGSGTSGSGLGGAYEFAFATLNGGSAPDTLYVADNYNDGVDKYSLVSGSWVLNGEIGAFKSGSTTVLTGISGVVAEPVAAGEELFMTTPATIYSVVDPYGYDYAGPIGNTLFSATPTLTTVAPALEPIAGSEAFRGIDFVPQSTLTVATQPAAQNGVSGGSVSFFSAAQPGTNESVQWEVNTGSGFTPLSNGTDANGVTIAGATSNTLTLSTLSTVESGYKYEAIFTSAAGTATSGSALLTVKVAPLFTVDMSTYSVNENAGTVTIYVDRGGDTTGTASVSYGTANGTATAGTNYTATSGTLTFGPTVTQLMFTVPITAVVPQGGNKTFTVTLTSPTAGGVIGTPASSTVTIVDTQEFFNLSSSAYTINDTDSTGEVSVLRSGPNTADAGTVTVNVTGGFTASGTATFVAGQTVAAASFPITADGANQTVTVSLGATSTYTGFAGSPTLGTLTSSTVSIVDLPSTPPTNTVAINTTATSVTDVETSGPYAQSYAPVLGDSSAGTGSFAYVAYEVLEFSPTTTPSIYPVSGTTVNANGLSNLSVQLFNTDATTDNYGGHPGNFNIYFLPDSDTTTPTSKLAFNTSSAPTGLATAQFTVAPVLLGTFSFNNTAGYDTYTATTIPSSVQSALVADLNTGSNFRLVVTPQTYGAGAIAVDLRGLSTGQTPIVSLDAAETTTKTTEAISFTSATYSESEAGPAVSITLTRSGTSTSDMASVQYATSDGTAVAGTNYTAATGTATFAAGSTTTSFTIPATNVANQYGDKLLNLTLSSPATTGSTTVGVLGSPSTATLTITDSSTAPTETLSNSGIINGAADVEVNGPYTDAEIKATDVSSYYPSYGVVDLNVSAPTMTVTAINSITLNVQNEATVVAGPVDFYLVSDNTSNIAFGTPQAPNPHFYDATQGIEGIGTQFGTTYLLGSYNLTNTAGGATFAIPLANYTPATETALISYLNSNSSFRIVMTPENSSVDANFVSSSINLSVVVQEGTVSSLPAWLSPTSSATYNSGTDTVTLTGAAQIIANPNDPNVTIVESSSADSLTVSSALNNSPVKIGSLQLTNGATASLAGATNPVLVTSTLSIDSTSKLDLANGGLDISGSSLTAIRTEVAQGYANGLWTGAGIDSSTAGADSTHLTALGTIANGGLYSTFDGASVGANDVLVKFTYYGDANLSGKVDGSDYSLVDNGYQNKLSGWYNGDFNYDGAVNGSDYTLIDNAFNRQGTAFSPAAQVASPATQIAKITVVPSTVPSSAVAISQNLFSTKKVKPSLIDQLLSDLVTSN